MRKATLPLIATALALSAAGCASAPPSRSAAPTVTAAPVVAPAPAPPATPAEEIKNTIRWSTASEVNNFGYDVYRGTRENGPFDRITPSPILGAGTTDEPQRYEFVDQDIKPGQDYFYYVESISTSGHRERFTPVRKVPAKGVRKDG